MSYSKQVAGGLLATMIAFMTGCSSSTDPQIPSGSYVLQSVSGSALPAFLVSTLYRDEQGREILDSTWALDGNLDFDGSRYESRLSFETIVYVDGVVEPSGRTRTERVRTGTLERIEDGRIKLTFLSGDIGELLLESVGETIVAEEADLHSYSYVAVRGT